MKFTPQPYMTLKSGTTFARPPELPSIIRLEDSATVVMTNFNEIHPVTIAPDIPIDDALERMKSAGVRLLLVTDDHEKIIGLITSNDIQGERPIEMVQEQRIRRTEITVENIMVPQSAINALDLEQVAKLQVGHIVATLNKMGRRHLLVAQTDPDSGAQQVCGLFSMSQIEKQLGLGRKVAKDIHTPTVAELVHELGP